MLRAYLVIAGWLLIASGCSSPTASNSGINAADVDVTPAETAAANISDSTSTSAPPLVAVAEPGQSSSSTGSFRSLFSSISSSNPRKPAPPRPKLYDQFLFYPTKFPVGDWDAASPRHEDANFTAADGTKLHGWYCPCESPRAVVLYTHGNGGNLTFDAALLARLQTELRPQSYPSTIAATAVAKVFLAWPAFSTTPVPPGPGLLNVPAFASPTSC
ncbi:MAG: hypothetical protein QM775_27495 [Pirellulales bacterium]